MQTRSTSSRYSSRNRSPPHRGQPLNATAAGGGSTCGVSGCLSHFRDAGTRPSLRRWLRGRCVVVDVRLSIMMLLLVAAAVIVAVSQLAVVVVMRVPVRPVVPLADHFSAVVMRNVLMIVRVCYGGMQVLRLLALSLRVLTLVGQRHRSPPLMLCSSCVHRSVSKTA
jgi:hypothetical protein